MTSLSSTILMTYSFNYNFLRFERLCQIESFLCINTLIKPEDQDRYLQEQKDKFTPFISELQMDADIKQVPYLKFPTEETPVLNKTLYFVHLVYQIPIF